MSSNSIENRIVIRRMAFEDLPQVEALDHVCFSDPWPENAFAYELRPGAPNICLVAVDPSLPAESDVIGVAIFWLIVDELHVGTIGVLESYRRRRVGLALIVEGLLEGSRQGAITSLLEVRAGNKAAQHLYLGLGYEIVGLRPRYYSDNHEDALLLTLPIIDPMKLVKIESTLPITLKTDENRVKSRTGAHK